MDSVQLTFMWLMFTLETITGFFMIVWYIQRPTHTRWRSLKRAYPEKNRRVRIKFINGAVNIARWTEGSWLGDDGQVLGPAPLGLRLWSPLE